MFIYIFIQFTVFVGGFEYNEQGGRERCHETSGPSVDQVVGKSPRPIERREPLQWSDSTLPAKFDLITVYVRPPVSRVRIALRVRHGACQDRPRIRTPTTCSGLVLGNTPEVNVHVLYVDWRYGYHSLWKPRNRHSMPGY